jgi:DNA-binding transcriptional LysR family regulator
VEARCEDRAVDLLEDGVDIAIRAGRPPPDSPFVVSRPLATFERAVCASPKLRAKCSRIDSVAQLPSWLADADLRARRLRPVLAKAKLSPVDVYGLFHAHARGASAVRTVLDHLASKLGASLGASRP